MCQDPNSPNPAAFCCMRGMGIAVLVFGVLDFLGALNQIGSMIGGDPCYICPSNTVDYDKSAGGYCMDAITGDFLGESFCDPTIEPTYAASTYCSTAYFPTPMHTADTCTGTWTTSTCGEDHRWFVLESGMRSGDAQCTAYQNTNTYQNTCCIAGAAPQSAATTALIQFIFGLIVGISKFVAGTAVSCCAGPPTGGKMKTAVGLASVALLVDTIWIIFLLMGLSAIGGLSDFLGPAIAMFFMIFIIVAMVWQVINVTIVAVFLCQLKRAFSSGIGKSSVPSI